MSNGAPNNARRQVGVLAVIGMAARISSQTMALVLLLLAGRFLTVELFGVFVLASILMNFAVMQMYSGIYHYVLREPGFEENKGAAFCLQILYSLAFTALILLTAVVAYLAGWGDLLAMLIAATALMPLLALVASWQEAVLLREGDVKFYYGALFVSELTGFIVGVVMLVSGLGVWSLIANRYCAITIVGAALTYKSGSLPKPIWNTEKVRSIIQFSLALYGNSALAFFSSYGAAIIIGGFLSTTAVGLYRMGARTVGAAADIFAQTFRILTWQAVGRMAREKRLTPDLWTNLLAVNLSIMTFVLGSLSILAEDFTLLVLSEDWLGMVPVLQIICWVRIVASIDQISSAQLAAAGETRFLFRTRLFEASILLLTLLVTVRFGVEAVAFGLFPSVCIYVFIVFRKLVGFLGTDATTVAKAVLPGLAGSVTALYIVYAFSRTIGDQSPLIVILSTAIVGALAYMTIVFLPLRNWTLRALHTVSIAILPREKTIEN